jgi:hypothetical protein
MKSARNGTSNGGAVVGVVEAFAAIKLRSTRRELNNDWRIVFTSSF